MGFATATIAISNPIRSDAFKITVDAFADTAAGMLCLPEALVDDLQLDRLGRQGYTTADGAEHLVDRVGPVRIQFEDRIIHCDALVLGEEVLLGAIPMEALDVIVEPTGRRVSVNPKNPRHPSTRVKSLLELRTQSPNGNPTVRRG